MSCTRDLCDAAPRPVAVRQIDVAGWMDAHGAGATGAARSRLGAMFDFYDRHGFVCGSVQLEALLGRPATPVLSGRSTGS